MKLKIYGFYFSKICSKELGIFPSFEPEGTMKSAFLKIIFLFFAFSGFFTQYAVPWLHKCPSLNPTEQFSEKTKHIENCHKNTPSVESKESGHSHSLCPVCQGYLLFCSIIGPVQTNFSTVQWVSEVVPAESNSLFSFLLSVNRSARAPPA